MCKSPEMVSLLHTVPVHMYMIVLEHKEHIQNVDLCRSSHMVSIVRVMIKMY